MRNRISRLKARISIVLFVVGIAGLLVSMVSDGWTPTIVGVVCCMAAVFLRMGKCPTCGRQCSPLPQWSEPGKYHCAFCDARFAYDDEPDEE